MIIQVFGSALSQLSPRTTTRFAMSLLQGVLRSATEDIDVRLRGVRINSKGGSQTEDKADSSDDDLVNVVSLPGTPSRTRQSSPVRGAASRPISKNPLLISSSKSDPLKAFPTDVSQRIFSRLSIKDLAKCALVSKKWARSQTLNYVWFQHYRKENFHDDSLPPGKWTKRESKQSWRQVYLKSAKDRSSPTTTSFSRPTSGYNSPSRNSGYQTPREIKEEQWRLDEEAAARPGKLEMREMYKELGGRKSRTKTKLGSTGVRDKGGWEASEDW